MKRINMMMKVKSILTLGFFGVLFLAVFSFTHQDCTEPNPEKEALLVKTIFNSLKRWHYSPTEINDDFSAKAFDVYIKDVDGGKRFLTKADYNALLTYRKNLDDATEAGTFEFFDKATSLLSTALDKTELFYQEALAQKMDFSGQDKIEADGEKLEWAASDEALRERWEKWMKYEVLTHIVRETNKQEKEDYKGEKKSFDELEAEGREKTLEKYDKWYKRMRKSSRQKQMEIYLNALTNVFDPHTVYFSPSEKENFDIQMSGKLEGIGARLQSDGEKTTVTEIVVGGPAWKQGDLEAEDIITKVAQDGEEAVSVMGLEIDEVVSKIRGPKGTIVHLTVEKPDGTEEIISIERDVVIMEEGFAKSLILQAQNEDAARVGYIFLPKFYADFTPEGATSSAEDVEKEIQKLKKEGVSGIILDLRNNTGGSLRDVIEMSGYFIEKGPIVQVKSRGTRPELGSDRDSRVQYDGPLVVMINHASASASEILAAAMQDYNRAVIVGTDSYGKGTVQRFISLDDYAGATGDNKDLGALKISLQKFFRINGKTTQLDGVSPDIALPDSYDGLDIGEREHDYAMPSTTIEAVEYSQNAYQVLNIKELRAQSAARVSADATFGKIKDNAARLERQKDESEYPLNYEDYYAWNEKRRAESKMYEDMLVPIEDFTILNLEADKAHIMSDTSRVARNDKWLKERKKDIQLYEAVQIMYDMIKNDAVAKKD